jgi:hypothetical protein
MNIYKNKNLILTTLSISLLFACGPSPEEIAEQERLVEEAKAAELKRRSDLATVTCNFMGESRNMDAAMRIKEINSARERLGEDLYLGTDAGIKQSFEYGLCNELVLNDPEYNAKLISIMELVAEQERQANEKARIAREKAAEEARIAREKREEEERIAAEKKAIEFKKNMKIWHQNFKSILEDYPINTSLNKVLFEIGYQDRETIEYSISCKNLYGLGHDIVFVLKDGLGELRNSRNDRMGNCSKYGDSLQHYPSLYDTFPEELIDLFYQDRLPTIDIFERVYIELTGDYYWDYYKENLDDARIRREIEKKIDPKTYGLPYSAKFDSTVEKPIYQIYPTKDK